MRLTLPALAALSLLLLAAIAAHADDPASPGQDAATPIRTDDPVRPTRRARSVELDAPVTELPGGSNRDLLRREIRPHANRDQPTAADLLDGPGMAAMLRNDARSPFVLLDSEVSPGTAARLAWQPEESFEGIAAATPVLVVNGVLDGPVMCLTAAVHGDELNGIEMVRRVLYNIDAQQLKGTVVGVPIVNLVGFRRASRYLADRRDLNRHFPGNTAGSSASRIAYSFFHEIIVHCNVLVDLHTGSFYRTNLPQVRGDLRRPEVARIAEAFTSTAIIHSRGATGTLRRAAVEHGIPSVTLEAGEPMRLQEQEVEHGVQGIFALLDQLGMYRRLRVWGNPAPTHYRSRWVRADAGGILFARVELGQKVAVGDLLGSVTDPITNLRSDIVSPYAGRLIGKAVDQFVHPGFAAFHIGIETRSDELGPLPPDTPAVDRQREENDDEDLDSRDSLEDS